MQEEGFETSTSKLEAEANAADADKTDEDEDNNELALQNAEEEESTFSTNRAAVALAKMKEMSISFSDKQEDIKSRAQWAFVTWFLELLEKGQIENLECWPSAVIVIRISIAKALEYSCRWTKCLSRESSDMLLPLIAIVLLTHPWRWRPLAQVNANICYILKLIICLQGAILRQLWAAG